MHDDGLSIFGYQFWMLLSPWQLSPGSIIQVPRGIWQKASIMSEAEKILVHTELTLVSFNF